MQQLVADDVRYVFGNPGTTEQPFTDVVRGSGVAGHVLSPAEPGYDSAQPVWNDGR